MKNNRISRWQIMLDKIDPNIAIVVDQLGKIDNKLIEWSKKHDSGSAAAGVLDDYDEYSAISYLWVLGAYEIIRTIHQRCKENNTFSQDAVGKIKETKDYFARVRIPLAKLEAEKHHKDIDYSIAFPHNTEFGIGWLLGDNQLILRKDLSNKFLKMLEILE